MRGPQARQRRHLRAALHLEHADGVGRAQQVVDLVLLRDGREVDLDALVLADEVDREVQHREHAEAEQVELHEARGRAVVLVPLEHRAALHARPLDRAELDQRPVGHHHAARVDAEVAREVEHLRREVERELRRTSAAVPLARFAALGLLRRLDALRTPVVGRGRSGRPTCRARRPGRARARRPSPSRAARERGRYVITLATCAARSRPYARRRTG